ncbi:related to carbohydrate kinase, contains PfkB domain [Phialocephala subalpina]|uniref:Related to carbohydrate kinase, contains PfkB domain n=1 Tax=Phialocephala subalpina TaxID=576137 RepID=A0A1L7WC38_9HELO|nr:related to carbohydrate kinase, contains PfkB domain [Phialocephala subalpina]
MILLLNSTKHPLLRVSSRTSLPTAQIHRPFVSLQGGQYLRPSAAAIPLAGFNAQSTPNFHISDEVYTALKEGRPVVALETTIYTHGFPYPDNVALALDLEKIVREHGAVPATIGILEGVARVGLTDAEITSLASTAGDPTTMKVSRRDLPYILGMGLAGKKLNGGTTVSGTMILASKAGIRVFGTGGLGGVHRGAESTMDISADLTELGRTPVAVISSGCKSFLDIPKTLEFLETQGVTVCTFADGRTGQIDFPAFYTRESGLKSPMVVQNAKEAAAIIRAQELLHLPASKRSGIHFANPIPVEYSIPKAEIDVAINQAVKEAAEQGFHGHANTPFILSRIKELTKGNSIPANRALIESNVAMAARVAVELARFTEHNISDNALAKPSKISITSSQASVKEYEQEITTALGDEVKVSAVDIPEMQADIIVLGSVAIDLSCNYSPDSRRQGAPSTTDVSPEMYTSNVAKIIPTIGGVGHNVALAAQRAGGYPVSLRSLVAKDLAGTSILSALKDEGLDPSNIISLPVSSKIHGKSIENHTAQYVAVNDTDKNLVMAMADMSLFSNVSGIKDTLKRRLITYPLPRDTWIVIDANWSPSILKAFLCTRINEKIVFEPVSVPKAGGIFEPTDCHNKRYRPGVFPNHDIHLSTPNQYELAAMHAAAKRYDFFESQEWWQVIDALGIPSSGARDRFVSITNHKMTDEGIPLQTIQLLPYIPKILTKLGAEGVLLTELLLPEDPRLTDRESAPYILSRNNNGTNEVGGVYMRLFPPTEVVQEGIVSVNGVGDTFLGVIVAGLAQGCKLDEKLIDVAQRGAVLTLMSKESVSPDLGTLTENLKSLAEEELIGHQD